MEDRKTNIIEAYRKELSEIHPALPAYFCATTGYIIPWPKNNEDLVKRYLLERVDPKGEVDDEVLDELVRIWASESWFGLAVHPPLAFLLLKRHLTDPSSKLSKLLYKDGVSIKPFEEVSKGAASSDFLQNIVSVEVVSESQTETKKQSRRKT